MNDIKSYSMMNETSLNADKPWYSSTMKKKCQRNKCQQNADLLSTIS